MRESRWGGITYFENFGFSINEGGRWANIHMSWCKWHYHLYFFILGLRVSISLGYMIR